MAFLMVMGVIIASYLAYKKGALTVSGTIGAIVVGTIIAIGTGIKGLALLATFFITSTFLSFYKKDRKANSVVEKDDQRDGMQVFANGGLAACASLFYLLDPSFVWIGAFIGAFAAATSDTWASEVGSLSQKQPIHIGKWQAVPRGTSGAVSSLGMFAAVCGASLIAMVGMFLWWEEGSWGLWMSLAIAGFLGNIADTVVGASAQVTYFCKLCQSETEQTSHCGCKTVKVAGVSSVNNDTVNVVCTLSGAILGGLAVVLF
ncbi:DUF92 domain-containing protein [Desertibacillus haloalkaliphilus]|uniref:DUF92 domain-containing protein n=1 Tax=Desertibacillus haloalkaliphilus TaxID=1328930 RepID=UPI001C26994E|nr:DUF92 domain-containing protein [Desertibacillus haloalkaliphilus]MBU8905723.1 DUF92 domain-containing protein [Desertibacillus haloalkaliphilus]